MTDEVQFARLKRSVEDWNCWREEHPNLSPDLFAVGLTGMDLSHANLAFANLIDANLEGCNLAFAKLREANLSSAWLLGANLSEVDLSKAYLWDTNLSGGNLSSANLEGSILKETRLTGANFSHAHFCNTVFVRVDLSSVLGLETAIHDGPSVVDIHSVVLPKEESIRLHFLRGVGFSDALIDALPSLTAMMQSPLCYLRSASQDEALAQRLQQDLQAHGVRCWLIPDDLHPYWNHIQDGLQPREKVLLVLSKSIVNSPWVQFEVRIALEEAREQGCPVLFPLRVDGSVLQTEQEWATRLRESCHIDDFTNWRDDAAYQHAFTTLLHHLKESKPPTR